MAVVGDRVQVPSTKVGEAPREGVVTGVTGSLLRVRWSTGQESIVVPSMGSLAVVGKKSGSGDSDKSKMNYSKASVLSHDEQLAIVQYSDEHGVKAAADHFAVAQSRVYDWRLDRSKLQAAT